MTSPAERTARALVAGALAVLVTLAWYWLLPMHMAPPGMSFDSPPAEFRAWTAANAWRLCIMWSVMMAGMMIPARVCHEPRVTGETERFCPL